MLQEELKTIRNILQLNGYLENFIAKNAKSLRKPGKMVTVPKKPVFIQLPHKGDTISSDTAKKSRAAIMRTYYTAELKVIVQTEKMPISTLKTERPFLATANCIFKFTCTFGAGI